jgi:hypothetical protein
MCLYGGAHLILLDFSFFFCINYVGKTKLGITKCLSFFWRKHGVNMLGIDMTFFKYFVLLDFRTVPTVWYFSFIILLVCWLLLYYRVSPMFSPEKR